jgi:hypothetical protein
MDGHKESNEEVQDDELRLAMGAQRNFDNVVNQGIKQTQAVNDPVLKAHLQYERQLDFCEQAAGDMLQNCLASVDKMKIANAARRHMVRRIVCAVLPVLDGME